MAATFWDPEEGLARVLGGDDREHCENGGRDRYKNTIREKVMAAE
jgi:hypothetical protein